MRLARKSQEPQRKDELEALLLAARAAARHPELEKALEEILDAAIGLVDADEGSIMLLDRSSGLLRIVAAHGVPEAARRQPLALGQGIAGTVAVTGQPLLLPSAVDVDRFAGYVPKERRIFASLCLPLRGGDHVTGVLSVNAMRPGARLSERDLRLAGIFAETAAMTIENSRLLGESRRHAAELETLRGAMLRLSASLDLETVADAAVQEAMRIARTTAAMVCVLAPDRHTIELARYSGFSKDAVRTVTEHPGLRRLAHVPELRVIAPGDDPSLAPLSREVEAPLAVVPLRSSDGRPGALLIVALPATGVEDLTRLLWTYGAQAGIALSNAILHRTVSVREHELDAIVVTLDMPIVLLDEERRFRAINPAAAHLLGISPDVELGRPAARALGPELEELAMAEDDLAAELDIISPAGTRTFHLTATTVDGGARVLVLRDVSTERDLERRKADFLAVVGHELRTPLTSIKGFASTLANHGKALPDEAREQGIRTILSQSERLERLIEDLLYVSRVETHRPPLHLTWDDLGELCAGVVGDMRARHPGREIVLEAAGGTQAFTDRVKVEQVLTHLIDNAVKYSDRDASVTVTLRADDKAAILSVRDRGRGIASAELARVFEPFTQLDGTATRAHGGTGVGLYVCATLAEALGGRIETDSVPGKGSIFSLVLPRQSVAAQRSEPTAS